MPVPIKLCREPWSKPIQHLRLVKLNTKAAWRKLRHDTKLALREGKEPPVNGSVGERY